MFHFWGEILSCFRRDFLCVGIQQHRLRSVLPIFLAHHLNPLGWPLLRTGISFAEVVGRSGVLSLLWLFLAPKCMEEIQGTLRELMWAWPIVGVVWSVLQGRMPGQLTLLSLLWLLTDPSLVGDDPSNAGCFSLHLSPCRKVAGSSREGKGVIGGFMGLELVEHSHS